MMKSFIILVSLWSCAFGFSSFVEIPSLTPTEYSGEPLFLTPYIEAGKGSLGRKLANVQLQGTNIKSYSGFITVNKTHDSNTFFWFFPAENGDARAPLVIWLQGGPGASSLYGLFAENGPFSVSKDIKLIPRKYSWSRTYSTLFIDNPVGTGFSFTRSVDGYARSEVDIGRDLYTFLLQFYSLFPQMRENELYITGESYAGKYVPAISHKIHVENPTAKIKINFKGMAIGDGWTDPLTMFDFADYLYQLGLLDREQRKYMMKKQQRIVKLIEKEDWHNSSLVAHSLTQDFVKFTGFPTYFNFMQPPETEAETYYTAYLNQPQVRRSLHVGNLAFNNETVVSRFMRDDSSKSAKPYVVDLLNAGYKVLFYSGQLDIIVAYPLTESFLWNMDEWKMIDQYRHSGRTVWRVSGQVAGYAKTVGNLQQVLVRNSGHMVPMDQPEWAYDLLNRFVLGIPF